MSGEQQFGLCTIAGVLVIAFLMTASLFQNDGINIGYKQGYSNAKAGICNRQYFICDDDDEKQRKHN